MQWMYLVWLYDDMFYFDKIWYFTTVQMLLRFLHFFFFDMYICCILSIIIKGLLLLLFKAGGKSRWRGRGWWGCCGRERWRRWGGRPRGLLLLLHHPEQVDGLSLCNQFAMLKDQNSPNWRDDLKLSAISASLQKRVLAVSLAMLRSTGRSSNNFANRKLSPFLSLCGHLQVHVR